MPPDREPNLDDELRDLGPRIEYPPTPDLASSVKDRLEAEGHTPASRPGPSLWWLAAAAALVLLTALPVLSLVVGGGMGGAGSMAGGAGDGGETGSSEQAAGSPRKEPTALSAGGAQAGSAAGVASVASGEAATAFPAAGAEAGSVGGLKPGESLGLGEEITLREAHARSDAPILLPRSPGLGRPDEVYDRTGAPGFVYLYRDAGSRLPGLEDTKIGLLLTQMPGDTRAAYLPVGTEGDGLATVRVNGAEGYWVPATGDSAEVARSAGLLAGVLLWERDGQALRIEANVSKREAVQIAESVR